MVSVVAELSESPLKSGFSTARSAGIGTGVGHARRVLSLLKEIFTSCASSEHFACRFFSRVSGGGKHGR